MTGSFFDIALSLTPRVTGRLAVALVEHYFSAENIFSQSFDSLCSGFGLREDIALDIIGRVGFAGAGVQVEHCSRHGIAVVSYVDEFYPPLLRSISDPPYVLYVQGCKELLTRNIISLIGTRKSSSYGERMTNLLVRELSDRLHNLVIASGLALGIDSLAHRAALGCDVATIAFLPTALPSITPAVHSCLAKDILAAGGALISEVAVGTKLAHGRPLYMQRNRLIVGCCGGTVVVESSYGGGAYKAAVNALDEGLVVGAVPGRVGDSGSSGCNMLLSSSRAFLVMGAESLLRELKWDDRRRVDCDDVVASSRKDTLERWGSLSSSHIEVLRLFVDDDAVHISELQSRGTLAVGTLTAMLMELTILGAVNMVAGSLYERLVPLSYLEDQNL